MRPFAAAVQGSFLLLLLAASAYFGYLAGRDAQPAAESEVVYTCSMHPQVRQRRPGQCPICRMELVPQSSLRDAIDPVVVQNMGVRVAVVERGPIAQTVRAFGALRAAEPRQRDVALKVGGFVEKLWANTEGMAIAAGDPLLELYSPDLLLAQEELLAAARAGDAELLVTARRKLSLWDVDDAQIAAVEAERAVRRTLTWKSPVDGILLERRVAEGAPVEAARTLLRIVDLRAVWLEAQVPESALALVRVGQEALAALQAFPGETVRGEIVFVAPLLDAMTRTATVRVELRNDDLRLKPGMYARVEIPVRVAEDAVVVPREAVIDTGTRQLAYLALGSGRFAPREVVMGAAGDGGVVEIRSGLTPGDVVVTSGQLLIDSESRLREANAKLGDAQLASGGTPRAQAIPIAAETRARIDAAVRAYLDLVSALSQDRAEPGPWQAFAAAAAALRHATERDIAAHGEAIATALPAPDEPVAARLQKLAIASERLIELLGVAPPSAAAFEQLVVLRCSMFAGRWLQTDETVRNPYFGSKMLECGTVERRLVLAGETR